MTYGLLTVIGELPERTRAGARRFVCRCVCGEVRSVVGQNLTSGNTQSCGCTRVVHGHGSTGSESPTYHSWHAMVQRCTNPKNARWPHYGGRGIEVCQRWGSFQNFLADMGERPEGTTLGRFGDEGNYEPGNCAWMTRREQDMERYRLEAQVTK